MRITTREFASDATRAALPHAESRVIARYAPAGLELHAVGALERVHRKRVAAGIRVVMARLPLGTSLGVPAGAIIPLDELWGDDAHELRDRLADARDPASLLEHAIARRALRTSRLASAAADRLAQSGVRDVAAELGVSERQLRRVFRDAVGVSPKAFARIARFHRAVAAARTGPSWARVAATAGFCDQAHLIHEFHAIAGTTPRAFMRELIV